MKPLTAIALGLGGAGLAIGSVAAAPSRQPVQTQAAAPIAGRPHAFSPGEAVYQRWCAACHDPGLNHAGTLALQTKYGGSVPAALKDRSDLSQETITYFVRHGVSIMPIFRKTEVSDSDLKLLGDYLTHKKPKR